MQGKLKKFERDTRDYQYNRVYTWADSEIVFRIPRHLRLASEITSPKRFKNYVHKNQLDPDFFQ